MLNILWIDEGEEYFEPVPQRFGPPTEYEATINRLMMQVWKDSNRTALKLLAESPFEDFGKIGTSLRIRLPKDFTVRTP